MSRTSTGVSLIPGATARIVARGKPTLSMNSACAPGTAWGDIAAEIPPDGGDINNNGAISMNLEGNFEFTSWVNVNHADSVYLAYLEDDPLGTGAKEVMVERKAFSYSCFTADNPPVAVYKFDISGSTIVTIDVLGVNVTTTDTLVASGQSVSAAATPLNFQGTQVQWSYDSAQSKPSISIPSCANALTCNYTPPKSGWLRACMVDEYGFRPVCGTTTRITVANAILQLLCSSVRRGAIVTCSATNPNGGPVSVTQWQFTSSEIPNNQIVESSTSLSWQGKAAVSGTVTVSGTADGFQRTTTAAMTVLSRDWSLDTVNYRQEEQSQASDPLPDHPVVSRDFGQHAPIVDFLTQADNSELVASGPNQGIRFFTKVPAYALSRISINRIAMSSGSDFYNLQLTKRKQQGGGLPPLCARSDVPPLLPLVISHEGLGVPPPATSHAGVFRRELNARVPQAVESAVAIGNLESLRASAFAKGTPSVEIAFDVSLDQGDGGGTVPPIVFPCVLKYFPAP